jgi:hypothetical protein
MVSAPESLSPHRHPAGVEGEPQALLALAQGRLRPAHLGDVDPLREDAGDPPVRVPDRLIDEIDDAQLGTRARPALEHDGQVGAHIGLARAVDLVGELLEALARHLGQRREQRLARDGAVADELLVGRVHHLEAVLGPAQHRHEARRLLEQLAQALALARQMPLGQDLAGGLGRGADHAGDAAVVAVGRV